jgi:hypothetical protein
MIPRTRITRTATWMNVMPEPSLGVSDQGRAAVRLLSRYTAEDRQLRLAEARELVDMLDAVGRRDQIAKLRLERFVRARTYG